MCGRMGVWNEDACLDSPPQVAALSMKQSDISGTYVNYTFHKEERMPSNFIVCSWNLNYAVEKHSKNLMVKFSFHCVGMMLLRSC